MLGIGAGAAGRDQLGLRLMPGPGFQHVEMNAQIGVEQFRRNLVLPRSGALEGRQLEDAADLGLGREQPQHHVAVAQIAGVAPERDIGEAVAIEPGAQIAPEKAGRAEDEARSRRGGHRGTTRSSARGPRTAA